MLLRGLSEGRHIVLDEISGRRSYLLQTPGVRWAFRRAEVKGVSPLNDLYGVFKGVSD